MFVLIGGGSILDAVSPLRRNRHHAEIGITYAGPIQWTIQHKFVGAAAVTVYGSRKMSLQFTVNKRNRFGRNRIERVIVDSLVANARSDCDFYLRYDLLATLKRNNQICLITIGIKNDRLPYLNLIRILEDEGQFFLLTIGQINGDVAFRIIDAFDSISSCTQNLIERRIAGLQLEWD